MTYECLYDFTFEEDGEREDVIQKIVEKMRRNWIRNMNVLEGFVNTSIYVQWRLKEDAEWFYNWIVDNAVKNWEMDRAEAEKLYLPFHPLRANNLYQSHSTA